MLFYIICVIGILFGLFKFYDQDQQVYMDQGERQAASWMLGQHNSASNFCVQMQNLPCATVNGPVAINLPAAQLPQFASNVANGADANMIGTLTMAQDYRLFTFWIGGQAASGATSVDQTLSSAKIVQRLVDESLKYPSGSTIKVGVYNAQTQSVSYSGNQSSSLESLLSQDFAALFGTGSAVAATATYVDYYSLPVDVSPLGSGLVPDGAPVLVSLSMCGNMTCAAPPTDTTTDPDALPSTPTGGCN